MAEFAFFSIPQISALPLDVADEKYTVHWLENRYTSWYLKMDVATVCSLMFPHASEPFGFYLHHKFHQVLFKVICKEQHQKLR